MPIDDIEALPKVGWVVDPVFKTTRSLYSTNCSTVNPWVLRVVEPHNGL